VVVKTSPLGDSEAVHLVAEEAVVLPEDAAGMEGLQVKMEVAPSRFS